MPFASSSEVKIAPWYPQENNYVFICDSSGFNATGYDWYFGDGEKLLNIQNSETYHSYSDSNAYNVSCTAKNLVSQQTAMLTIGTDNQPITNDTNSSLTSSVSIAPWFPQGNSYVFICNTPGFTSNLYNWNFGDGEKLLEVSNNNVYHTYPDNNAYAVSCEALGVQSDSSGSIIIGNQSNETPPTNDTTSPINETNQTNVIHLLTTDANGWTAYLLGWSYSNGIYYADNTQPDVPVESYYTDGFQWTDYNVSVSMNIQSSYTPADSQLILRYQNSLNYVACRIMQYNGSYLEIMDPQHNVLNSVPYQFNVGQWYTLQAGINGNSVTCQVANHPETLLNATYNLTNSGTVGLRGTHIPVQYQNMTITFIGNETNQNNFNQTNNDTVIPNETNQTIDQNTTNQTNNVTIPLLENATTMITIAPDMPRDHNYAFECNANFNATSYSWNFGDNSTETNISVFDRFHSYPGNGTYLVSCNATDGVNFASNNLSINVTTPLPPSQIISNENAISNNLSQVNGNSPYAVIFTAIPLGNNTYELQCRAVGFEGHSPFYTPGTYWSIPENVSVISNNGVTTPYDINISINQPGSYLFRCAEGVDGNQAYTYYNYPGTYVYHNSQFTLSGWGVNLNLTVS